MAGIKDAAVRLFASRGYANTSLEDVASAAGFTKGAVYYYFKSKERLLLNVMQDIEGRSIDKTVAAVHSRVDDERDHEVTLPGCVPGGEQGGVVASAQVTSKPEECGHRKPFRRAGPTPGGGGTACRATRSGE